MPAQNEDVQFLDGLKDSLTEIRDGVDERIDSRLKPVLSDLRLLKERSSRSPFGTGGPGPTADAAAPVVQLAGERKFQDFLKADRGRSSVTTFALPFRIEKRAAILNTGGTAHYNGVQGPPQPGLRLVELLTQIPMSSGAASEYARETSFVPGADIQVEGALKKETVITFENALATVKTIATWLKTSIQSLADTPGLQNWLSTRLSYAVMLKAEDTFLNAADGLLASATTLAPEFTPVAPATQLDAVAGAIGQLQSQGFVPDGIVLNAVDASKTRLLKATDGSYLWATPDSGIGMSGMWSVPVVISPSMPPSQFLVGSFSMAALLFVRQTLVVEIAYENEDDFIRNLATLRAEERMALAVPVPSGLVKGAFTAVPPGTREARESAPVQPQREPSRK